MLVVGLTGSLKTGKSSVTAMLAKLGAKIIDADAIAHESINPKGPCYQKVIKIFGKDILSADSTINRKKLGEVVFKDRQKLKKMVGIIHPVVIKTMEKAIDHNQKRKGVLVLDVPLLFESGMGREVDVTVVVKARRDIQIKRAVKQLRISKAQALNRIKAQMPLKQKIRLANFIIDNDGTMTQTKKQVVKLWDELSQKTKK